MARQNDDVIPFGVNQFIAFRIGSINGIAMHDIGIYEDTITMLACLVTKPISSLPTRMSHAEAYKYFSKQFSTAGIVYPKIQMMKAMKDGSIEGFILDDYKHRLHNVLIQIFADLKKQGVWDWTKMEKTSRLIRVEGGWQLAGENTPLM